MAQLRSAIRSALLRAATGDPSRLYSDEGEFARRVLQDASPSSVQQGIPAGVLRDGEVKGQEAHECSPCEEAVALACSWRHRGASEEEGFELNAAALADEVVGVAAWCPFPWRLEPVLLLMADTAAPPPHLLAKASPQK
ncbi:hypothetical protein T484DRAFT_1907116 [Baffinella frigidus]|nr:hypothetical protein T484DRAFT_1907116 [Cryptophyta sp. CCMP2293]